MSCIGLSLVKLGKRWFLRGRWCCCFHRKLPGRTWAERKSRSQSQLSSALCVDGLNQPILECIHIWSPSWWWFAFLLCISIYPEVTLNSGHGTEYWDTSMGRDTPVGSHVSFPGTGKMVGYYPRKTISLLNTWRWEWVEVGWKRTMMGTLFYGNFL